MSKRMMGPQTALGPVPAVMVSCGTVEGPNNIITLAWAGTINSDPPMLALGVRPGRLSYDMIKESGHLVVNLASEDQAAIVDYCGVVSGRKADKFEILGLTPMEGAATKAPLIAECPVNLECVVRQELGLPTHQVFIVEVLKVWADEAVLTSKGTISPELLSPICFMGGHYWSLKEDLGKMGALARKI